MALKVTDISFPGFTANCYLVTDMSTGESFLVDPGAYGKRQSDYIKSQGIDKLSYILLTHGHFDHMLGAEKFRQEFSAKVVIHCLDEDKLSSAVGSLYSHFDRDNSFAPTSADITVKDGDTLPFGKETIEVIHTPGHTKGGVCYKIRDLLFTGDTLFKSTIGRTDFPDSDEMEMLESLIKLDKLDMNYKIYPGHEGVTTLDFEKQTNKYMKLAHKRADK
jgi:glyoxylase-like metal-dependent hydrolase (beta-lactamase superfamily II)